jgi:UDP-N-acetylglucosamine 2-epimerase
VEAGLRTGDRYSPYPEELNRQLTGRLSTLHFCPTERNRENLRAEGISEHVYVTGNTVIDALRYTVRDGYAFESPDLQALPEGELILVTAHRRENLGEPMRDICGAILDLLDAHRDAHVVLPMHKSPAVREILVPLLGSHPRVRLIEPVGVYDLHNLMNRCKLVLTDSGGLQEEAPALGKPVLVLRRETERPEAVEAGTVKLAGVNRAEVFALAHELLSDARAYEQMAQARNPYGDGHTSERISAAIQGYFAGVSG